MNRESRSLKEPKDEASQGVHSSSRVEVFVTRAEWTSKQALKTRP